MAKQRFRDLKKGKIREEKNSSQKKGKDKKHNYTYASGALKTKAFLTDSFMLLMPIMYVVFYLILDGREDFAAHRTLGWLYILIPLIIVQTAFLFKSGQTPGYRAYNLTLIDENSTKRPSLSIIIFRNIAAVLSFASILGWIMMYFRKDSKTLHDFLTQTVTIVKEEKK